MLIRCGDDLYSIATASPQDAQALAVRLRESGDWLEVIPGINTVVVRFDAANRDDVRLQIEAVMARGVKPLDTPDAFLEIPVVYGGKEGPDFDDLCQATGLSADEVIQLHTGREYVVDMVGFTPGFAFIGGLDERLRVPRRKEPRQRVAAGSIGIAGEHTGLYAIGSPGGWTLIGRTPCTLFDPVADNPFTLSAGMRVRFKAIVAHEFDA